MTFLKVDGEAGESNMQEYTVRMSAMVREYAVVTVQASNSDEAKRKARQLVRNGEVEFCDASQMQVRVTDCEVEKELTHKDR